MPDQEQPSDKKEEKLVPLDTTGPGAEVDLPDDTVKQDEAPAPEVKTEPEQEPAKVTEVPAEEVKTEQEPAEEKKLDVGFVTGFSEKGTYLGLSKTISKSVFEIGLNYLHPNLYKFKTNEGNDVEISNLGGEISYKLFGPLNLCLGTVHI